MAKQIIEEINEEMLEPDDRERARLRINLWHGNSNNWINMIKENIGNSLDVFKDGKHHNIDIIIKDRKTIEYKDDGRGIPVEGLTSKGTPKYVAIFERPMAGSKYGAKSKTVGQNGVFLWTLAMTSKNIDIEIARPDGNVYGLGYTEGIRTKEFEVIGKSDTTYSKLLFELDESVWTNVQFTFEEICNIAEAQASLGDVTITVKDEKTKREKVFEYDNGILDYFKAKTTDKSMLLKEPVTFEENGMEQEIELHNDTLTDNFDIELMFNISNDNNENLQKDFLNTADLIQHGTIQDGVLLGFKNGIHKYLKDNNLYKKTDKAIKLNDIEVSLNYICNVRNLKVEYENQTKQRIESEFYKPVLKNFIESKLELYFIENPKDAKKICNQILVNSKARVNADKARTAIQKKLGEPTVGKVKIEGLTDCKMRNSKVEDRILLVVEGKSAKSTVVEAYDNNYMGALGLRGRFISCLKKTVMDVLNNTPARTLIRALGCGIDIPPEERKAFKDIKSFNKDNLRYGKIGILTDADCFGSGIRLALLTFFYKYMPEILKEGRVYIVVTPRYQITMKDGTIYYPYTDREKQELIDNGTISYDDVKNVGIIKGLGELDKDYFWDKVLSPEAREHTFVQVTYEGVEEEIEKLFNDFMGTDTAPRKEFVREFITNFDIENIE